MKHTIILLAALLALGSKPLFAQQTVVPSAVRTAVTSGQTVTPTATQNYIRTETYLEGSSPSISNPSHINVDIQYFDGLGRPIETVAVKASPTGKDIVALQTYDSFGRDDKSYLPLAYSTDNKGAFVAPTYVTNNLPTYIGANYDVIGTDANYGFSQPQYEASPLNRILKQGAPGADWQPSAHPVQYGYQTNTAALPLWKYTGDTYAPVTYPAKSLYVNTVTDEDGKVSKTYTDKQGKVVMKEVVNGSELLQTRYCYDDFELLRCVLQPMAANPTQIEYCFFYKYDSRKRMIEKKVPGSDWVYLVYDARDRLVFTSDGNLRTASSYTSWYYTRYDDFNRPIEHGKMKTNVAVSHQDLQAHFVDKIAMYTENGATYTKINSFAYDQYPNTEPFLGLAFSDNTLVTGKKATSTKGLQVGKWHTVFDENNSISGMTEAELYYYDNYRRVIQVVKKNFRGFIERVSNAYNFAGQVVQTRTEHLASGNNTVVDTYYTYDHRGRLLNTSMQVTRPSGSIPSTIVSANVYNEAGLLSTKYLHSQSNQAFLQKIDYKYNIRGWLTQINNPTSLSEGDKFGMKIGYNKLPASTGSVYYNGNISGIQWSSPSITKFGTKYTYDAVNNLTNSTTNFSGVDDGKFYASYVYNKNGNLTNNLIIDGTPTRIDQLTYGYLANSNQLSYVQDYIGDVEGVDNFPGTASTSQQMFYDANGNVKRDSYRNVAISYNQFNLPYLLDFGNSKSIEYIYNGSGQKVLKVVINGATPYAYTEYLGQFIYESIGSSGRTMKSILTPEGRIVNSGTNAAPVWKWEYNLTDHLGNVRVVLGDSTAVGYARVLQEIHYYPFGMRMTSLCVTRDTDNDRLYNGKELQDDFGLNWYDYGARFYDPALGKWHSVDPHAELYTSWSPYNYVYNNPINGIDPDGRDGIIIVFPDYKISTPVGKIGGLGHAGVLLIDNKTGSTKYYEYGRYDKEGKGIVRNISVSNVKMGKNGMPTQKSMDKVMKQISDKAGHGGKIEGAYIKSDKFKEMNDYAQDKMKDNSNPDRKEYSLTSNSCGTFAADVVKQDEEVKKDAPVIVDPRPNSIVEEYQDNFQSVHYDPKTTTTTIDPKK